MDKIHDVQLMGHRLRFQDRASSSVVPYIAHELNLDLYSLSGIQLNPNDAFMDIGANVGMTSILANRLFNCKIVAIEPIPCNFANLQANLGLNNCDLSKFTLINQAAASCRGNVEIDFCDFSTGNSSAYRDYGNKIVCPKCVVRELLIEHRPRYLKIDCEGAEFDFIPDLTAESLKSVEWIGIELHPATSQTPPEVLLEHLRGVCKAEIILA